MSKPLSAFIEPGESRRATLEGKPGLHPEIEFEFKPATYEERCKFLDSAQGLDRRPAVASERLARHVMDLRVSGSEQMITLTKELATRLHPELFTRAVETVLGDHGGDLAE